METSNKNARERLKKIAIYKESENKNLKKH